VDIVYEAIAYLASGSELNTLHSTLTTAYGRINPQATSHHLSGEQASQLMCAGKELDSSSLYVQREVEFCIVMLRKQSGVQLASQFVIRQVEKRRCTHEALQWKTTPLTS
jgi:hypothetical protein